MVIFNNETSDRGTIRQGFVNVNSQNVSPTTITATASGRALTQTEWEGYDMFNVAQTSAGTDSIVIPNSLPVGTRLFFQAASAISLQCPSGSSVLLNNVAAPAQAALAINTTVEIFKVSATRVIFTQRSTLGAATNPIPA
jgi:hypothetical protein